MTPLSEQIWALGERAHAPLAVLALLGAVAIAAMSRDLMKRLLAATLAAFAAVAHVAALRESEETLTVFIVLALAAAGLGVVLALRIGEAFGAADAVATTAAIEADADRDA